MVVLELDQLMLDYALADNKKVTVRPFPSGLIRCLFACLLPPPLPFLPPPSWRSSLEAGWGSERVSWPALCCMLNLFAFRIPHVVAWGAV